MKDNNAGNHKPLTYRVENIPPGTSPDELRKFFYSDDQDYLKVKSICPSVEVQEGEEGDLTATVFFHPQQPQDGPRIALNDSITVDKEFYGFTPLYVPPKGKGNIVADIVAVTGLAGHAYGSWAHSPERMWLRDYLPKDAPNTRILTYGYPAKLQNNTVTALTILQDHTNTFVNGLIDMRESGGCETRPIIFIGHSLGCLIIKKALTGLESMGISRSRLPVRAFIFLAGPHRGLSATSLQTLVKRDPGHRLIDELKAGSPTLTDINLGFTHVARDIEILTCYETKPIKTFIEVDGKWKREGVPEMMVSPDSAQHFCLKEKSVSADEDHSSIAKLRKGQHGIYPNVKAAIRHGLISTAKIKATADASLEPMSNIEKNLVNISISGGIDCPSHSPPYAHDSDINAGPSRPGVGRATSSSILSPTSLIQPSPDDSINFQEVNRDIGYNRNNPYFSTAGHGPNNQSFVSSSGVGLPSLAAEPPYLSNHDNLSPASSNLVASEPSPTELCSITCDSCDKDIPNSDFHYSCYDCLDNAFYDGEANAALNGNFNADHNVNAALYDADTDEDAGSDSGNDDKDRDTFDLCQRCFNSGTQGLNHAGHKFVKHMVISYGGNFSTFPYPERQVSFHDSMIVKALKEGDNARLREAIRDSVAVQAYDSDGNTPLHLAIFMGLTTSVEILLDAGASREAKDRENMTPLMNTVHYSRLGSLKSLLDKGVSINASGGLISETALHVAVTNGQYEIIRILLGRGADVNAMSNDGTPIFYSVIQGDKRSAKILLDSGANPNLKPAEEDAVTPLIAAATENKFEIVELLKRYGAKVEEPGQGGTTPLMKATKDKKLKLVKQLLRIGAKPDLPGIHGETPLLHAVTEGLTGICKALLYAKADIEQHTVTGDTPLMMAIKSPKMSEPQKVTMVKLLLRSGAKPDHENTHNETPFMFAALEGWTSICCALLCGGKVDIEQLTPSGETPLVTVTKLNKPGMVRCLLNHGAEADVPDSNGETPLIYACFEGWTSICDALLSLGKVNIEQISSCSATPLMIACQKGNLDLVRVLVKHNASLNRLPKTYGHTAITMAAEAGHADVVQFLLERGASAMPPPLWKKWKNFSFDSGVDPFTQSAILDTLRNHKHR